jgi:hypothetical protein
MVKVKFTVCLVNWTLRLQAVFGIGALDGSEWSASRPCRVPWLVTAKLPLAFDSTVILGSASHGTRDHVLLFDLSGSLQNFKFLPRYPQGYRPLRRRLGGPQSQSARCGEIFCPCRESNPGRAAGSLWLYQLSDLGSWLGYFCLYLEVSYMLSEKCLWSPIISVYYSNVCPL